MKHAAGYGEWRDAEGRVVQEFDSCRCCHCQSHIFVKPGTAQTIYLVPRRDGSGFDEEAGAFCRNCMAPVCLRCHAHGICDPFIRAIERSEAATERRDALARLGRYTKGDIL